jgi:molybdopterin-guanine dinucleotide biosynthesis protein A
VTLVPHEAAVGAAASCAAGDTLLALPGAHRFNPYQIAFIGNHYANDDDAIHRVIGVLSRDLDVGYVRLVRDGQRDRDEAPLLPASATVRLVENDSATERTASRPASLFERRYSLLECDLVVAHDVLGLAHAMTESDRTHSLADSNVVLLLDRDGRIPAGFPPEALGRVIACVAPERCAPNLDVPRFQLDDAEGLAKFLRSHLNAQAAELRLYGLVLAGGRSKRMGSPKWALKYRGEPHALSLHRMLSGLCSEAFLSIRRDQESERELVALPHITDRFLDMGPLGGILSAMTAHPDAAWLVVACDLPFLEADTLLRLVNRRAPFRFATSYRSPHDSMPEPLCAIYEPKARLRLFQSAGLGFTCPRKMLMNSRIEVVKSANELELSNANHPQAYREALARLQEAQLPEGGREQDD